MGGMLWSLTMSDEAHVDGDGGTCSAGGWVFIKPAIFAPIVLVGLLVWAAFELSPWALIGIPFAVLGTLSGQPNLNLADGCLAYIATIGGFLLISVHSEIGLTIAISSYAGLWGGAIEKRIRAVPYDPNLFPPAPTSDTAASDE